MLWIKSAPDRTEASIAAFLRPIARSCTNVKVVITDLFRPYAEVVKILFAKARHLLCHVHGRRAIMRKMQKLEAKLARLQRRAAENGKALEQGRARILTTSAEQRALAKKIGALQSKIAGLKKKKRAARGGRTKTVDKQLASAQARLCRYSAQGEELEKKLAALRERRDNLRKLVRQDPAATKNARQDVLQSARLAQKFYDLLEDRGPQFEGHKDHLLELLGRTKRTLAPYLAKFINEHPQLFSLQKARDLKPNFQNTNTIEGVFGLFRPLLNSTRLIQTPAGTNAYGELFRLYHNTTPPYTGPRNNTSPAERLGVKLHGKTYLDLLFPPRGRVTRVVVGTMSTAPENVVRAKALPGPACEILAC